MDTVVIFTPAPGPSAGGALVQAITPVVVSSQVNVTTITFSGITLPAGSYILAFYFYGPDKDFPGSVTVDGNTADNLVAHATGDAMMSTRWINLASPISTADVIVTGLTGVNDYITSVCDIYEIPGGFTTEGNKATGTGANPSTTAATTIDVSSGQTVVGFGLRYGSGGYTWNGVNDEKVTDSNEGAFLYYSVAYEENVPTDAARAVDWTCGTSETRNMIIAAAFTP